MIHTKQQLEERGFNHYVEGGFQYYGLSLDNRSSRSAWIVSNDVDQYDDDPQFVMQLQLGNTPVVDKFLSLEQIDLIIKAFK